MRGYDTAVAIIEALEQIDDPVATAGEIAERVDVGQRAVLNQLDELRERGVVDRKDVGARAVVWWLTGNADVRLGPTRGRTDSSHERSGDDLDRSEHKHVRSHRTPVESEVSFERVDVPGQTEAKQQARTEAVRASYDLLRERGEASASDFKTEVYPDHTAHYTDADDPAYSWWKNCVLPGLKQVAEQDDRVQKGTSHEPWRFE